MARPGSVLSRRIGSRLKEMATKASPSRAPAAPANEVAHARIHDDRGAGA